VIISYRASVEISSEIRHNISRKLRTLKYVYEILGLGFDVLTAVKMSILERNHTQKCWWYQHFGATNPSYLNIWFFRNVAGANVVYSRVESEFILEH
jgi:hypothetical protein